MEKQLQGRRCLIVGGTTGIGRAAAERFLDEGARLVVAGRSAESGARAVAELASRGEVHFVPADVGQPARIANLFDQVLPLLGGLDVLYHVAGISGRKFGDGPLHECSDDGWQTTVDVNLRGLFLTNRAAVRHFLHAKRPGIILNMASVLAFSPSPRFFDTAAYAAAKGGIIALSRQAAASYAKDQIRVNVIAPALIDTPMAARAVNDPAIRAFLHSKQPLAGGPGAAEDCAAAAVFLCSDAARLITGAVLTVDAGWCLSEGQFS